MQRCARHRVPRNDGCALHGDADGVDATRLVDAVDGESYDRAAQRVGVELGEARRRSVENQRFTATRRDGSVGTHDTDAHRRGADVDGEDTHAASLESRAVARERAASHG